MIVAAYSIIAESGRGQCVDLRQDNRRHIFVHKAIFSSCQHVEYKGHNTWFVAFPFKKSVRLSPQHAYKILLTTVTGANGGLGSAITRQIVNSPELAEYHGLYTVRSSSSGAQLSTLLAQAGSASANATTAPGREQFHTHDVITLDLTSQRRIRDAALNINARVATGDIPPIRALVLNAGFQDFGKQKWVDDDGLDVTFASNYLGHWLLVLLLLKSMDREHGRIVVVGSQAHECVPSSCSILLSRSKISFLGGLVPSFFSSLVWSPYP